MNNPVETLLDFEGEETCVLSCRTEYEYIEFDSRLLPFFAMFSFVENAIWSYKTMLNDREPNMTVDYVSHYMRYIDDDFYFVVYESGTKETIDMKDYLNQTLIGDEFAMYQVE